MDATTFMMPLIQRISSLGYILADGAREEDKLTERQVKMRIKEPPTLLQLIGYITFPVASIMGPFLEF